MKSRTQQEEEEKQPLISTEDRHQDCPVKTTSCRDASSVSSKCVFGRKLAMIGLGLAVVASALCYMTDSNGTPIRYQLYNFYDSIFGGYGSDNPTFACSGHGIKVYGDKCLCDLGYSGEECSDVYPTDVTPKSESICLVLESFGSIGSTFDGVGQANAEFALSIAKVGYAVTVLYTGAESAHFSNVATLFAKQGVLVTRLPQTGVQFGENAIESKSYSVYQYLLHSSKEYSHVYFSASSGVGYYTLLAQSQGLFCSNTVFVNSMDSLPLELTARLNSGDADTMIVDKDTLKLDYFMKKSAELADINIISSNILFDQVIAANWTINKESTHVLAKPPPKISVPISALTASNAINEIVFVGEMTNAGGLKVFCDAIDAMISDLSAVKAKITFLGTPGLINDMKSDEYIELRSLNWDAYEVTWKVVVEDDMESMARYLNGKGRLAVYPALNDAVGAFGHAMIRARIPILVSEENAVKEILSASDKSRMVVAADGASFAEKLKSILSDSVGLPTAKTLNPVTISNWLELFETKVQKKCNSKFDELADKPLVSVVLVHHNRHQLLKQAISSLYAQTYKNFEVIIVDDGSSDPVSLSYVRELSWKWWEQKGWKVLFETNRYLGAARNTGARAAVGKYVLFLDDDDYSKPHHIETLIKVAINTEADVVTGGHDVFNGRQRPSFGNSNSRYIPIGNAILPGMLQNVFGDSAMMVRRDYFVDLGGFSEDYGVGFEDYEFLARSATKNHNIQAVPESLHWYRHHGKTMSTSTNLKANQLRMLRPYIEAHPTASLQQRAVFDEVQKQFFEKYGVKFNQNPFGKRDNATVVPITPLNPYVVSCAAYTDQSGASAIGIYEQEVWVNSVKSACWNMGANSPPAGANFSSVYVNQAIQPVYPDGSSAGYPIVNLLPCAPQYSDVWNVVRVTVNQGTPYNSFKTYDPKLVVGSPSYGYFNRPLVPPGTTVSGQYSSNPPVVQPAWNAGRAAYFIDFGPILSANAWDYSVPAGQIVDVAGAGPVASDGTVSPTSFYTIGHIEVAGITRYQTGDFRIVGEFTYPYLPTPVMNPQGNNLPEILNCPFAAADSAPTLPTSHKTFLFGVQPEIATKTSAVTVVLWGMSFTSSSVVYVNGAIYTGKVNLISSQYLSIVVDFTQFSGASGSIPIYVDDSIPYTVRYYQTPATVSGLTTSTLYTSTDIQPISITGQNLPQLTGGFCVFNATSNGVATPLYVTSSTTAWCNLPNLGTSGVYNVNVVFAASKYNVPQLNLVQGNYYTYPQLASSGSTTVTVFAKAPKAIAAQFSNNGASIFVDVDTPATIIDVNQFNTYNKIVLVDGSIPLPCSAIFQTAYDPTTTPATGKLGNKASDCLVQQLTGTRFKISLQAQFTAYDSWAIVPGQMVKILSGSLWAAGQNFVQVSTSSVTVSQPAVVPNPIAIITAPVFIPSCQGLILPIDLTASSGSAGRNYTVASSLTFTSSIPNWNLAPALTTFLAGCVAQINQKGVCAVPISMLWSQTGQYNTYTFTLSLTNYLGGVGTQSTTVNFGWDATTPYVTVTNVPESNAKINQVQVLKALGQPACGVTTNILYQWSANSASCPGLPSTIQVGSQLVIQPFTLQPKTTCTVTLNVQYAGQPNWLTTTSSFTTAGEIIGVSAGSSRTLGQTQSVVVDATFFSDAFNNASPGQYQCAWSCINSHGFLCAAGVSKLLTGCAGNVLTGQIAADTYTLSVAVLDAVTGVVAQSKSSSKLTIVGGQSVPSVKIAIPNESTSPYSNTFALSAVVDASTVSALSNVKYSWSSCNDPRYSSVNFANANNFMSNATSAQILKFTPGVLLGDTTYCVAVTVQDGASTATAKITFETYEVPFGGFCFLQSSSITALNQPLQYSCPYWAADPSAQPLSYKFFVKTNSTTTWTQVVPTDRSSLMSSTFTTGQYQIQVVVSDQYQSSVYGVGNAFAAAKNLQANAYSTECTTNACVLLKQANATWIQTGNSILAAQAIGSAALDIDVTAPDFPLILDLLTQFTNDTYVDTVSIGPFLASILQKVAGKAYALDSSVMPKYVALVNSVINQISSNGLKQYPPNCVDIASASSLFLVLDQTLGSKAYQSIVSDADRATTVATFNNLLDTLSTCFARTKAAEEYPFSFSAGYITRKIGVAFTDSDSTFCDFKIAANAANTDADTVSYSCGTKSANSYPHGDDSLGHFDSSITDLTVFSGSTEKEVQVTSTNFSIPFTPDFQTTYGITATSYSNTACTFFNKTTTKWSTDGCKVLGATSTALLCTCNHLTDFRASASSAGGVGMSIGAIIGCVIGALALVVVTAGSIYHIRRQQQAESSAAAGGGSLLPTTTPPPLAPVLDAPITQPVPSDLTSVVSTSMKPPPPQTSINMFAGAAAGAATVAAFAVAAAVVETERQLPSYAKPPSYEYHMQRSGR